MVAPGTYWSVENSSCSKVPGRDNYTFFHLLLLQPVLVFILITDSLSLYSFWCFSSSIILSPYQEILTFSSCFLRSFFFFFYTSFWSEMAERSPNNVRLTHCSVLRWFIWKLASLGIFKKLLGKKIFIYSFHEKWPSVTDSWWKTCPSSRKGVWQKEVLKEKEVRLLNQKEFVDVKTRIPSN